MWKCKRTIMLLFTMCMLSATIAIQYQRIRSSACRVPTGWKRDDGGMYNRDNFWEYRQDYLSEESIADVQNYIMCNGYHYSFALLGKTYEKEVNAFPFSATLLVDCVEPLENETQVYISSRWKIAWIWEWPNNRMVKYFETTISLHSHYVVFTL